MNKIKNTVKKLRGKWHGDMSGQGHFLKSIASYCQNQFAGETAKDSEIYKYISEVHSLTKIYDVLTPGVNKTRVGRNRDGGYIMAKPYSRNKIAYSFGIDGDVSWDLQMADEGYQVYQYDHTINGLPAQNDSFHWNKLGVTGGVETKYLKRLKTLIRANGHESESGMVLKMDIEGYEWAVFANADADTLKQFDQITVEFHDLLCVDEVNIHLQAFRQLGESFAAIHIHPNTCSMVYYCGDLMMPSTLELTFVRRDLFEIAPSTAIFPTLLDRPNGAGLDVDNMIGKW